MNGIVSLKSRRALLKRELTMSFFDLREVPFTRGPVESLARFDDPVEGANNLEHGSVRVRSVSENDINYKVRQ